MRLQGQGRRRRGCYPFAILLGKVRDLERRCGTACRRAFFGQVGAVLVRDGRLRSMTSEEPLEEGLREEELAFKQDGESGEEEDADDLNDDLTKDRGTLVDAVARCSDVGWQTFVLIGRDGDEFVHERGGREEEADDDAASLANVFGDERYDGEEDGESGGDNTRDVGTRKEGGDEKRPACHGKAGEDVGKNTESLVARRPERRRECSAHDEPGREVRGTGPQSQERRRGSWPQPIVVSRAVMPEPLSSETDEGRCQTTPSMPMKKASTVS